MSQTIQALAALALTPDGDLETFRKRRLARHADLDVEHLRRAKTLLAAIAEAMDRPGDQVCWARIRAAHEALRDFVAPLPAPVERGEDGPPPAGALPAPGAAPPLQVKVSGPPTSPWAARARRDATPAAVPAPKADAGGETIALAAGAPTGPALPFREGAAAEAPMAATAMLDVDAAGGTMAAPEGAAVAAALPFEHGDAPSLERYAELCAESALHPDRIGEINARHGLGGPGARGRVDLAWQKRLAKDPALRARWQSLFDAHKREQS